MRQTPTKNSHEWPPPGSSLWLQHQQETTQLYDFCLNKIFTKQEMKKKKKKINTHAQYIPVTG